MRACSALIVHPDARFRTRVGGLMRRSLHPIFFASDAPAASAVVEEHPSISLVAVAQESGGEALLAELRGRRANLLGFVLSMAESSEPGRAGLEGRLNRMLDEAELSREQRLRDLIDRRMRRRISRAADRLAGERMTSLSRLAATGTGER